MCKYIILIAFLFLLFQSTKCQNKNCKSMYIHEFIRFLYEFRINSSPYHKSHIIFPIQFSNNGQNTFIEESAYDDSIKSGNSILYYFFGFFAFTTEIPNPVSYVQKTDKILLQQIDSSQTVDYYFRNISDNWYLFKIVITRINQKNQLKNKENPFEVFISEFLRNKSFQIERTVFPYRIIPCPEFENDTTVINNPFESKNYLQDFNKVFFVYDNFEKTRPSLEMVNLCSTGNEGGIYYGYIFALKNRKWYLIKGWDCSN